MKMKDFWLYIPVKHFIAFIEIQIYNGFDGGDVITSKIQIMVVSCWKNGISTKY